LKRIMTPTDRLVNGIHRMAVEVVGDFEMTRYMERVAVISALKPRRSNGIHILQILSRVQDSGTYLE